MQSSRLSRTRLARVTILAAGVSAVAGSMLVAAPAHADIGYADPAIYYCEGVPATIVGTNAANLIFGTGGNDVIVALGGNDRVYGMGGHDKICGGPGEDRLYGGAGDDIMR